ncbi:biopolymer transporter ExbB [Halovulum dunhuangense]|uniref:Biopolymer transporter ExbB n=1 Tax=Halovulum dunhuangense TaxID=1505036 RepID=A0A849KYU7_9RHOB|nr:biopolymer transporter ExbB [Halovulum dunhuangense]NNU79506.1 biopolymer transporter ExbB [Halovulum dunhuangense]
MDREQEPSFSQPFRQIVVMILILVLVAIGGFFAYPSISPIFLASPYLNGLIMAVFVVGVLACFWQVLALISAVSWIEGFALDRPGHEFTASPRLLASLSAMLRDSKARQSLNASSTRSILDSVATRLDEARDITRYIINLLIFLGLLGTFYGLATTVPAVVDTIRSLAPQEGQDSLDVFDNLMSGLEQQLGGMGTAFASSLLGLAGSLVVGLLELFAGHGQNRFYSELEEWLSSITKVSLFTGEDGGTMSRGGEIPASQIAKLNELAIRGEASRIETDAKITRLTDAVMALAQQLNDRPAQGGGVGGDAAVFERIAAGQDRIAQLLEHREDEGGALDPDSRMRLRNIDVQLLRILEEMAAGRQDSVAELRQELAALNETIRRATGA